MRTKTLVVQNEIQKILWENELRGQLSDGKWENSYPHDHWKPWCNCEVVVGEGFGRNFYAPKDSYNFTGLIESVQERMLFRVKAHLALGLESEDLGWNFVDGVYDWDNLIRYAQEEEDKKGYWNKKLQALKKKGITREKLQEVEDYPYTLKDLKKELSALKSVIKVKN